MRMWNVPPEMMCRRHLLGEHLEMHMFAGAIKCGRSLKGYLEKGLVETGNISARHDELAAEMQRRGYRHNSPLEGFVIVVSVGSVNTERSIAELCRRCPHCKKRIKERIIEGLRRDGQEIKGVTT